MERPSSGSERGRADDPRAARLLVDEETREVLGAVLAKDASAREIADELGHDLDRVLYRLKRLVEAGLVAIVDARARGGRPIKVYRSPYDSWFVPFHALPYADVEEALTALHVVQAQRVARASARRLQRTSWSGFIVERRVGGRVWMYGAMAADAAEDGAAVAPLGRTDVDGMDATVELRLDADAARRLDDELRALVERYLDASRPDARTRRLLAVASVPIDEE